MLEKEKLLQEAENAIKWIKEYVETVGAKGVVVGNSGGKDSATVIAMSTKALGADKVLAVSMPCNSIKEDLEDARIVAEAFDVRFLEVNLNNTYNELEEEINSSLNLIDKELNKEAKVNIKPRLRMTSLYGIARKFRIFSNWNRKPL